MENRDTRKCNWIIVANQCRAHINGVTESKAKEYAGRIAEIEDCNCKLYVDMIGYADGKQIIDRRALAIAMDNIIINALSSAVQCTNSRVLKCELRTALIHEMIPGGYDDIEEYMLQALADALEPKRCTKEELVECAYNAGYARVYQIMSKKMSR